jgi:hypothetical protein
MAVRGMGRDEDNRHLALLGHQVMVEFDAAHAWKAYVQYEAVRPPGMRGVQELLRRGGKPHLQTGRPDEALERLAHRDIIIDDFN